MANSEINDTSFKQLVQGTSDFVKWFWTKSTDGKLNGDLIIDYINKKAPNTHKLRHEEKGPYVYGVIVNSPKIEIEVLDGGTTTTKTMKLMKVGWTMADTASANKKNRMATVIAEVQHNLRKEHKIDASCSIIFVLPINATDVRAFTDVEKEIRTRCGISLPPAICKALKLPLTTEWVVTTDEFTGIIRSNIKKIETAKTQSGSKTPGDLTKRVKKLQVHDTDSVFEGLTFDAKRANLEGVNNTIHTIQDYKYVEVDISYQEESRKFKLLRKKKARSQ